LKLQPNQIAKVSVDNLCGLFDKPLWFVQPSALHQKKVFVDQRIAKSMLLSDSQYVPTGNAIKRYYLLSTINMVYRIKLSVVKQPLVPSPSLIRLWIYELSTSCFKETKLS
jgi:hypothetical protein